MLEEALAGEVAEALGLDSAEPGGPFLEELFVRFQQEVPYQRTATAESAERALARFLENGTGIDGDGRTGVFLALAEALGLEVAPAVGVSPCGARHALGLASFEGRELLVDPSFPLPCLVPLHLSGRPLRTGYGDLSVEGADGDRSIVLETRERSRILYRLPSGAACEPLDAPPRAAGGWGLAEGELFRLLDDRLCRWREGTLEVLDRWSRLRVPLPGRETALLGALFHQPVQGLGETPPSAPPATLDVYESSALTPEELRQRCEEGPAAPQGLLAGATSPVVSRAFTFAPGDHGTRARLSATLAATFQGAVSESHRKTLVFHLATELLDLCRG